MADDESRMEHIAAEVREMDVVEPWVNDCRWLLDRCESLGRQLNSALKSATSDDSELQGELDAYIDAHKEIREVIGSLGINNAGAVSGVKNLADALTAERELSRQKQDALDMRDADLSDVLGKCFAADQATCSGLTATQAVGAITQLLTAERAKVAELQHQIETANAANARRAEESQLEPVG